MAKVVRHSDTEIFAAVRHAIDDQPSIPQSVRVHVDRGAVTLTGIARWPAERFEAEEIARRVRGVRRVDNRITLTEAPLPAGFEAPDELGS